MKSKGICLDVRKEDKNATGREIILERSKKNGR